MNILLDVVEDQSGKQYKMDHYATRYPTNVEDIAGFLVRAIGMVYKCKDGLEFTVLMRALQVIGSSSLRFCIIAEKSPLRSMRCALYLPRS